MDATKLIEEAEIWAREIHASEFPDGAHWSEKFAELAAALKASEERARKAEDEEEELRELVARYQEASGIDVGGDPGGVTPDVLSKFVQSEEARANAAEKQCTELAAANLAANKRIVELEHERDAARAELARLTTPRPIAEAPRDGTVVLGCDDKVAAGALVYWDAETWTDGEYQYHPTQFLYLPLPEVKP